MNHSSLHENTNAALNPTTTSLLRFCSLKKQSKETATCGGFGSENKNAAYNLNKAIIHHILYLLHCFISDRDQESTTTTVFGPQLYLFHHKDITHTHTCVAGSQLRL